MEPDSELSRSDVKSCISNVSRILREKNISQAELSKELGGKRYWSAASGPTITRFLKGERPVTYGQLTDLASVFGVSPADLLTEELPSAFQEYLRLLGEWCRKDGLANIPLRGHRLSGRTVTLPDVYVAPRISVYIPIGDHLASLNDDLTSSEFESTSNEIAELVSTLIDHIESTRRKQWGMPIEISGGESGPESPHGFKRNRFFEEQPTTTGLPWDIMRKYSRIAILGDPGSGKSTLLRMMCLNRVIASQSGGKTQTPLFLSCRHAAQISTWASAIAGDGSKFDAAVLFVEMLLRQNFLSCMLSVDERTELHEFLCKRLECGNAIVFVDGIDELLSAEDRSNLLTMLTQITRSYVTTPVVFTSRFVGYTGLEDQIKQAFSVATVDEFDGHRKNQFASKWCRFGTIKDGAPSRQTVANMVDMFESMQHLVGGNPLLLACVAVAYTNHGNVLDDLASLCGEMIDTLWHWKSDFENEASPLSKNLVSKADAEAILNYVALYMCSSDFNHFRISGTDLRLAVDDFIAKHGHAVSCGTDAFIEQIDRFPGVFRCVGTNPKQAGDTCYEFIHLVLQEYMAAGAIISGTAPDCKSHETAECVANLLGGIKGFADAKRIDENLRAALLRRREVLRFSVKRCTNLSEVERIFCAIRNSLPGKCETPVASRIRKTMAAYCLTMRPPVADNIVNSIIDEFVKAIGRGDHLPRPSFYQQVAQMLADDRYYGSMLIKSLSSAVSSGEEYSGDCQWLIRRLEKSE